MRVATLAAPGHGVTQMSRVDNIAAAKWPSLLALCVLATVAVVAIVAALAVLV